MTSQQCSESSVKLEQISPKITKAVEKLLIRILPQCSPKRIVYLLYHQLIKVKVGPSQVKELSLSSEADEKQFYVEEYDPSDNLQAESEAKKNGPQRITIPYNNILEFSVQQQIAKAFIEIGYGIKKTRLYLKIFIENTKYVSTLHDIVRNTFRKIQSFLKEECRLQIQYLTVWQYRSLKRSMINLEHWLKSQDLATFRNHIRLLYQLCPSPIKQTQTLKLYKSLMEEYERQKSDVIASQNWRVSFKNRQGHGWTPTIERQMMDIYYKEQTMASIKDYMTRHYPHLPDLFDRTKVQVKFERVMRMIIRNFENSDIYKHSKVIIPFSDYNIKCLIRSPVGLVARIKLIGGFLNPEQYPDLVRDTIQVVKEFMDKIIPEGDKVKTKPVKTETIYQYPSNNDQPLSVCFQKKTVKSKPEPRQLVSIFDDNSDHSNHMLNEDDLTIDNVEMMIQQQLKKAMKKNRK